MGLFDMFLNRLKNQSPEKYKAFMAIRNSGKDPMDVLGEMYGKGELNDSQLNQVANMLARMGKPIPQSELSRIRSNKGQNPEAQPKGRFKGIF